MWTPFVIDPMGSVSARPREEVLPHGARHLAVKLADPVDPGAGPEREHGHVEHVVAGGGAAQIDERGDRRRPASPAPQASA